MDKARALANLVFVAVVLGLALSLVFGPLLDYSRAMQDWREFWLWVAEWIGADLLLTAFLCRRDLRVLVGRPPRPDA